VFAQSVVDPDSIRLDSLATGDHNPYSTLYSMNSWTVPVLDHEGKPLKDGYIIQIIADGGNGIQDPPDSAGNPGGDDTMVSGSFDIQYVNGEKHQAEGVQPGMFIGVRYLVPYRLDEPVYLRIWEGSDPMTADYYLDSEEYTTFRGSRGGCMLSMRAGYLEDIDWRFGSAKRVERKK
jgi:hypothetical protein